MNDSTLQKQDEAASAASELNAGLEDRRRWRIERKNGDVLRSVLFPHFTGENGFFLNDRCAIGNMEIGHMLRVDGNAIFRIA